MPLQTDRGGEVTFHGPGQVVAYLLMDLRRNKPGGKLYARQFVAKIEQAIINVLAAYNLGGERVAGAPGIYIAEGPRKGAKIAALGLKVRGNGCTYHGVSLNVAMDLAPFTWINPCGYSGLETVDMRTMGVEAPLAEVQRKLAARLVAAQVHQQVHHHLARPVEGDFAAAVGLNDGHAVCVQHMTKVGAQPQRKDRWMLDDPQFVGRVSVARIGESAHGGEGRLVVDTAEVANERAGGRLGLGRHKSGVWHLHYIAILTMGWAVSARYRSSSWARLVARTVTVRPV